MPEAPRTGGRLLRRALTRHRGRVAVVVGLLGVWQLAEALVPVLIGVLIDQAVAPSDERRLLLWLAVLAGVFVVLSWSYRIGARTGFGAAQREIHLLRTEIAGHVLHPRGERSGSLPGETLSLAGADADQVGAVIRLLGHGVAALVALVASAVLLLRIDVPLGLIVLGGVPAVLLCAHLLTPVIERRTAVQQASIARAGGLATDLVRGLRPLTGIGGADVAVARYRTASRSAQDAGIATARAFGGLYGFSTALSGLLLAVVGLVAGRLTSDGGIGIGELIAVVGLVQFLAEPLEGLSQLTALTAASRASARRIATFLGSPRRVPAGGVAVDPDGRAGNAVLALEDVRTGELAGLTLGVRDGELLGVVVPEPAAAAALVDLLRGERGCADGGAVRLHGVPLADADPDTRRRWLTVLDSRVDLFEGTLRQAVDPWERTDDAALARALHASAATDVVGLDPAGLGGRVTAGGATLSGGQRQRIALARALLADPPVLVLQDPTTAVDAVTEQRIAEGLRAFRHEGPVPRCTVLLTSSPALLAAADRVVLVSGGRVRASGPHRDLVRDPEYRAAVLR